jgi:hypothetical protein
VTTRGVIGISGAVMAIDLLRLCRDWQPDLLVRDTSEFGGCVAAEALGLPHATVRTGAWTATYALRHRWTEALAPLRERAGLDPDPGAAMPFRYLHLAAEPPGFSRPGDALAPTAHLLRPESSEGGEPPPPWLAGLPDRPTVYATLGTVHSAYPAGRATFSAILTALGDEPYNLVVTVGRDVDPTDFGPSRRTSASSATSPRTNSCRTATSWSTRAGSAPSPGRSARGCRKWSSRSVQTNH